MSEAEQRELFRKREEVLKKPCPKLIVVGECGDGKSTIVNAIRRCGEATAEVGLNPRGVTKFPGIYLGDIRGKEVVIVDTPGIGDRDVTPGFVAGMVDKALGGGQINGIIMCSKIANGRVSLGGQMVQLLLELGIMAEGGKYENVILCGTQADRCSAEEIQFFRTEILGYFNSSAEAGGSLTRVAVVKNPRGGQPDIRELEDQILSLPAATIRYTAPSSEAIGKGVADIMGIPETQVVRVNEVVQDVEAGREGDKCFAMSSRVRLESGKVCRLCELKPGDRVPDKGGFTCFIGFMHLSDEEATTFVEIKTADACVKATPGHLVFLKSGSSKASTLVPVETVRVGSSMFHSSGAIQEVQSVTFHKEIGYLAPLTASGTLFVDDLLVSCYCSIPNVPVSVMHAATLPFRGGLLSLTPPDRKGTLHWYLNALQALVVGVVVSQDGSEATELKGRTLTSAAGLQRRSCESEWGAGREKPVVIQPTCVIS